MAVHTTCLSDQVLLSLTAEFAGGCSNTLLCAGVALAYLTIGGSMPACSSDALACLRFDRSIAVSVTKLQRPDIAYVIAAVHARCCIAFNTRLLRAGAWKLSV